MIFGKTRMELKVGIFVFMALIILISFILLIGGFRTWAAGYKIKLIFNFINGVKVGAPVRFSGFDVGEVKDIGFIGEPGKEETKIEIIAWIKNHLRIPADSTVWVNTLGLLGERYIEIMPGKDFQNPVPVGGSLIGTDPVAMHEVTLTVKRIAANLEQIIDGVKEEKGTIGKLIFDDTIYLELEAFIQDIRKHPWKLFIKGKEDKK